MAYSTIADVQTAAGGPANLVALADLDHDGVSDAGVVDLAIAEADSVIKSYAWKRWDPETLGNSPEIVALSARMAARILRGKKPGATLASDVTQEVTDRKWLEGLARGDVRPSGADAAKSSMVVDKAAPRDSTKNVSRERTKGFW